MSEDIFRPLITIVRIRPDSTSVEVTLDEEGRLISASAEVRDGHELTAAAEATCKAAQLLGPDAARVTLAWVEPHTAGADQQLVNASVIVEDGDRRDELLGVAFVRTDPLVAAVRAVLDALPRRLARTHIDPPVVRE